MSLKEFIKLAGCNILLSIGVDRLLRYIYRKRLLVVMYHGVTTNTYVPPVWTQLPEDVFEEQIKWLAENFHPIGLEEFLQAVQQQKALPRNSILVTFDDGLKNNVYTAYPILQKYHVPAVIFLTIDFIGTDKFCWVDELYSVIQAAHENGSFLDLPLSAAKKLLKKGKVWEAYLATVEFLKLLPEEQLFEHFNYIVSQIEIDRDKYKNDFGMMNWEEVRELDADPLITFGAHTANHRILTRMPQAALQDELFGARDRMEEHLGHSVTNFCYPNGRLGLDFTPEHMEMLRDGGYACAFATNRGMFDLTTDELFSIPRASVGHDFLAKLPFFKMNVSGLVEITTNKNVFLPTSK